MSRWSSSSTRAARESTTSTRDRPKSRLHAHREAADSRSACSANASQLRADVAVGGDRRSVHRLLLQLGRRQVSEMLIEPVGHERARDPRVPPRLGAGVLEPLPRDVPVVDDVVVVEDHEAGDGREQPADVGVGPRLAIEAGVLLEVGNLLAWRLRRVAPAADELGRLGRHLVGVDLVADRRSASGQGSMPAWSRREYAHRASTPKPCSCRPAAACTARAAGRRHGTNRTRAVPRPHPPECGSCWPGARHRPAARPSRRPAAPRTRSPPPRAGPSAPRGRSGGRDLEGAARLAEHVDVAGAVGLDPQGRLVRRRSGAAGRARATPTSQRGPTCARTRSRGRGTRARSSASTSTRP